MDERERRRHEETLGTMDLARLLERTRDEGFAAGVEAAAKWLESCKWSAPGETFAAHVRATQAPHPPEGHRE